MSPPMGGLARSSLHLAPALAVLAAGCATMDRVVYSPDELRAELRDRLGEERASTIVVPFEVGPQVMQLAHEMTIGAIGNAAKMEKLSFSLANPSELHLRYDEEVTAAAEETLVRGGGDCLSLTNLFVGMARGIGLQVVFVDARGVQNMSYEGDLVLDRRHIVAGYGQPPDLAIVDFDRVFTGPVTYRVLTDVQALARFYNNLGYAALRERRDAEALALFQIALDLDAAYAAAYNNAGIALLRIGRTAEAVDHLRSALRHDPEYASAMINLARVLGRAGRAGEARDLRARAATVRIRDPLWRVLQGQDALARGDAAGAAREFRLATKLDRTVADAWVGLAQAYEALGDRQRALSAARRAARLAPQDERVKDLRARLEAS